MYNGIKYLCIFSLGATVGSVATWAVLKKRYEQFAEEDARSIREEYARLYNDSEGSNEDDTVEKYEYERLANAYTTNSEKGGSDSMRTNDPRVILPREFEEIDDYETISLNYYADGVLADDMDEIVEDVEGTVGDFKDHFGEYESDTVYVRNDRLRCYYEICADDRNYYEVADQNLTDEE